MTSTLQKVHLARQVQLRLRLRGSRMDPLARRRLKPGVQLACEDHSPFRSP